METRLAPTPRKRPEVPTTPPTDAQAAVKVLAEIVAEVASGDQVAFRVLYDATSARVMGLALQILRDRSAAEDALVDVYAQVWRQASRYDPAKGSVPTWIATMARTRAIDVRRNRARTQRRETALDDAALEGLRELGPDPADASADRERAHRVRGALEGLPREQRRALEAAYFSGLSHTEVAQALGQPLGTVKTRIRSGLSALRQALTPTEGEFA